MTLTTLSFFQVESRESHLPERSRSPSMSKKSTPRSKRTPSHERPLSAPERSSDNPGPNHNDHATTITKAPNGSHAATREDASEVGSQSVDLQNPESSQTSEAPLSSLKLTKKGKERLLAERRQQESKVRDMERADAHHRARTILTLFIVESHTGSHRGRSGKCSSAFNTVLEFS